MQSSRNPAKSRPLSANVKRLMQLARASPQNPDVIKVSRPFTERDLAYCHKQGNLFMEAASMGFSMEDFAPLFMTSQLAGVFDVSFSASSGMENDELSNLLRIPMLLKSPGAIVEALYWIDDIISKADDGDNKSLLLSQAYEADQLRLPAALQDLPGEPNRNIDELSYAYWLGYIYRCECLMHEESSRMVYGAFAEPVMKSAYEKLMTSPLWEMDLSDAALEICRELDRLLVEKIWPIKQKHQKRLQEKESQTTGPPQVMPAKICSERLMPIIYRNWYLS